MCVCVCVCVCMCVCVGVCVVVCVYEEGEDASVLKGKEVRRGDGGRIMAKNLSDQQSKWRS